MPVLTARNRASSSHSSDSTARAPLAATSANTAEAEGRPAAMAGAGENMPTLRQIARILRTQRLRQPWDTIRAQVLRRISKL